MPNMKMFEGTKRLGALPMTKSEYCTYRGWPMPVDEDPEEAGYLVEYVDGGLPQPPMQEKGHTGYVSWSPADVFDRTYRPCDTHTDRMSIELEQLSERTDKLGAFIDGEAFGRLDWDDQVLLKNQHGSMVDYRTTLLNRLARYAPPSAEEPQPQPQTVLDAG